CSPKSELQKDRPGRTMGLRYRGAAGESIRFSAPVGKAPTVALPRSTGGGDEGRASYRSYFTWRGFIRPHLMMQSPAIDFERFGAAFGAAIGGGAHVVAADGAEAAGFESLETLELAGAQK